MGQPCQAGLSPFSLRVQRYVDRRSGNMHAGTLCVENGLFLVKHLAFLECGFFPAQSRKELGVVANTSQQLPTGTPLKI